MQIQGMILMTTFEKARTFVYRNARPLDLARWKFHFEGGSREDVLDALRFYRNDDGGFGHALEADLWNPSSTPISTWAATMVILETGLADRQNELIQGILRYLESGADFDKDKMQWLNTVPSNNDHPHAIWWSYDKCSDFRYNPTAALAAFIIRFAEKESPLYNMGCDIAKQAVEWFRCAGVYEQHITACFITLCNALEDTDTDITDMSSFRQLLAANVSGCICRETERWESEYVCKPSNFGITKDSFLYDGNEDICQAEADHIRKTQLEDGSFTVPWQWYNDYREYETAANFWRSNLIIEKMLFLKAFE